MEINLDLLSKAPTLEELKWFERKLKLNNKIQTEQQNTRLANRAELKKALKLLDVKKEEFQNVYKLLQKTLNDTNLSITECSKQIQGNVVLLQTLQQAPKNLEFQEDYYKGLLSVPRAYQDLEFSTEDTALYNEYFKHEDPLLFTQDTKVVNKERVAVAPLVADKHQKDAKEYTNEEMEKITKVEEKPEIETIDDEIPF